MRERRRWRRVVLTMEAISPFIQHCLNISIHILFVDDGVRYEDNPDKIVVPVRNTSL